MQEQDAKIAHLRGMGFGGTISVLETVLNTNKGDVDKAVDDLLTINANLDQTLVNAGNLQPLEEKSEDEDIQQIKGFNIERSQVAVDANKHGNSMQEMLKQQIDNELEIISNEINENKILQENGESESKEKDVVEILNPSSEIEEKEEPVQEKPASEVQNVINSVNSEICNIVIDEELRQDVKDVSTKGLQEQKNDASTLEMEALAKMVKESRRNIPRFAIYKRQDSITHKAIMDILGIKRILAHVGVTDAKEVDLSHDYELAGYIKAKCRGKLTLPVLFMRGELIGGYDELNEIHITGELQKRIEADKEQCQSDVGYVEPSADDIEFQLNTLDKCLNVTEAVLGFINPLNWIWGKSAKSPDDIKDVVELDVIQANWYWRHQLRKLRFGSEMFFRVHPTHLDVRAAHRYDDVSKLTIVDNNNLIIRYVDNSSPDFITCPKDTLNKILELIQNGVSDKSKLEVEYKK